jgi:sporulation protein YlmC with PRC-barrel domain
MSCPASSPSTEATFNSADDAPLSLDRRQWSIAIASGGLLALGGFAGRARAQTVQLVAVDVKAVGEGYRASKLLGTKVENEKNEKIGTLDDLVITMDRKLFAVLQVGGFLGLGGHLIAVPYESLAIDDHGRKITLPGASKDAVHKLPEFQYPQSS